MRFIRFTIVIFVTLYCTHVYSQTQKGVVKTRGRMTGNGAVIAGSRLPGTLVKIKGGNGVVSQQDGTFTLSLPEKRFVVEEVVKNGYALVDPELLFRQQHYSVSPLVLLLEQPGQQLKEKLAVARNIRRTLEAQLEQREKKIEAMKLSEADYLKEMQKLQQLQSNDKLIDDLVSHYAQIDYDETNATERQLADFILNGRLTEADSLLHAKGDINGRIEQWRKHEQANMQLEAKIKKEQDLLSQSRSIEKEELRRLGRECYSRYEIALLRCRLDSAAHYIALRASLDTTNIDWQNDAGRFFFDYIGDDDKARHFYHCSLQQALKQYGAKSGEAMVAYSNMAAIFKKGKGDDYSLFERYMKQAITICQSLFGEEHAYNAVLCNNMGLQALETGNYEGAKEYLSKALEICEMNRLKEPLTVISVYNNLGSVCYENVDFKHAESYFKKALAIADSIAEKDEPLLAQLHDNLGNTQNCRENYDEALQHHRQALSIRRKVFGEDHRSTAVSYNNMGSVYYHQRLYTQAMECFQKAFAISKESKYGGRDLQTSIFNNIGLVHYKQDDYERAKACFQNALNRCDSITIPGRKSMAVVLNNLGHVCFGNKEDSLALSYFRNAVEVKDGYSTRLEFTEKNIKLLYLIFENYDKSFQKFYSYSGDKFFGYSDDNIMEICLSGAICEQKEFYLKAIEPYYRIFRYFAPRHSKPAYFDFDREGFGAQAPSSKDIIQLRYSIVREDAIKKDISKDIDFYVRLVEARTQKYGANHLSTAIAQTSLAAAYLYVNKNIYRAKKILEDALSIRLAHSENFLSIAIGYMALGRACYEARDYPAARENYKKAMELIKSELGETNVIVQELTKDLDSMRNN